MDQISSTPWYRQPILTPFHALYLVAMTFIGAVAAIAVSAPH